MRSCMAVLLLCVLSVILGECSAQHPPTVRRGNRQQQPHAAAISQQGGDDNTEQHSQPKNGRGHSEEGPNWGSYGPRQIDYRITRLEVQLAERAQDLRTELRENTRRLQTLEWQNSETQSTLEAIRSDLNRIVMQQHQTPVHQQNHQQDNKEVDKRVEGIVNLVLGALKGLGAEMGIMKNNITTLTTATNEILEEQDHLVTKQFFSNGILDIKHHQSQGRHCSSSEQRLPSSRTARDCSEHMEELGVLAKSGVYKIHPDPPSAAFLVYCDMETNDGGWTVIQNRFDGSQEFYQKWHEYKHGFGNLGGEFWLGLEKLHQLTSDGFTELLIQLEDHDMQTVSAHYTTFSVGPEIEGYPLQVLAEYNGTAGDSMSYHAGSRFSTKDMDQDGWPEGSCAQSHSGGWWYKSCDATNLNGRYLAGELPEQFEFQGMYWKDFRGPRYSLYKSKMMIRNKLRVFS